MMVANSKQLKIAKRYAQALCSLSENEVILTELNQVYSTLNENTDLRKFLLNPIVTIADKLRLEFQKNYTR